MVSKPLASFLIPRIVGKWTQFAIKVEGNTVTLFVNCSKYKAVNVNRKPKQLQFDEASKLYIAQAGPLLRKEYAVSIWRCFMSSFVPESTPLLSSTGLRPNWPYMAAMNRIRQQIRPTFGACIKRMKIVEFDF